MSTIAKKRIDSIDLLKGLVMVIMALDHVRDYFHHAAFLFDPTDPVQSNLSLFFTRFITNFCAPAFSFLAGTSAYMVGRRKTKNELSIFLLKRGLWLIFIEMTIVNFAWYFDIYFRSPGFLVIWSLGISMILLAFMIRFSAKLIMLVSMLIIFGHNLLDPIHFDGSYLWALLHERSVFTYSDSFRFYIDYPILPWVAIMSLGYYFGTYYDADFDDNKRKSSFNQIGIAALCLFVLLRWTNIYGDPVLFLKYETWSKSLMSFLRVSKYPPSLLYVLLTLGGLFLFLANSEKAKGAVVNFFCTFGRVPFFYYILHIYLIHIIALVFFQISGLGWQAMILPDWVTELRILKGHGYSLWVVYVVWVAVIVLLYPFCKWFDQYKQAHKEKWWLSYL